MSKAREALAGADEVAMAREVEQHGLIPEGSADRIAEERPS